jgi:predicted Zn-dependent protease
MTRFLASAILLSAALAAGAQETPDDMYAFMAARLAAERGEFSRALDLLGELIEKRPNDPILRYERAEMYASAAKLEKAITELREVVKLSPKFYEAQRLLGRILIDTSGGDKKKVDEALIYLDAAYRLQPSDLGTGLALVQIHLAAGRAEEAEKVLGELAESSPDNRTVNYQYSQLLMKAGRGQEAKPYLERVVAADPLFGPAVFQLVELYQADRDWIRAADALGPLIAADSRNVEVRRRQAYFYLEGGQTATAVTLLEGLLELDPRDDRSRYLYGEALSALARYEKANEQYRTLLKGKPNDPELLISIGSNQMALGELDDARKTFEVMSALPNLSNQGAGIAKTQLAAIDHQKGKYTEALAAARAVLDEAEAPNYQAVSIALDVFRRESRFDEAATFLDGLIAKFPDDQLLEVRQLEYYVRSKRAEDAARRVKELQAAGPRGTLSAAQAYAAAEDFKGGIAILEAQRKLVPDEPDVLFQLGAMYERDGAIEKAEETFLDLLARKPDHSQTLNYLGYMWADRNVNLGRAETMLVKAVSMQPRNGAYIDSLGWVYFRLGKLDLAKRHLEDATVLVPRDATIRHHLGDVYAKLGLKDEALAEYRNARDFEPDDATEAKTIAEKIALLEAAPGRK